MSLTMSTCPSVNRPAPIPMVGTLLSVMSLPTLQGQAPVPALKFQLFQSLVEAVPSLEQNSCLVPLSFPEFEVVTQ